MFWEYWSATEKGGALGIIFGLIITVVALFFSETSTASICFIKAAEETASMCVRYIAFFPILSALIGLFIGWIVKMLKGDIR
jgi:Na+(H+)/acetate symporter ActP